jgi:hypothetical protein
MDRSVPAALQEPTSHLDIVSPEDASGHLVLSGQVRDLITASDHTSAIAGEARVRAELEPGRILTAIDAEPWDERLGALRGLTVGAGFREALGRALAPPTRQRSPLALLLDDLPVAALIAGYADLYRRSEQPPRDEGGRTTGLKSDICSGWRADGTMLTLNASLGYLPVPVGPAAPALERADDPYSWHRIEPTTPGMMRRRRLIDVAAGDPLSVFAMFRDTYTEASGVETVLHEYTMVLTVDPADLTVAAAAATQRNLPWVECPAAAGSAGRIVGRRVEDLHDFVRGELRGISTCTHLNDLLRSLRGIGDLHTYLVDRQLVAR